MKFLLYLREKIGFSKKGGEGKNINYFDNIHPWIDKVEADALSGKVDWFNYDENTEFQEEIVNNTKVRNGLINLLQI